MESQYKEALALYNQCEYEKAYDILSNLSLNAEDKGYRFKNLKCRENRSLPAYLS